MADCESMIWEGKRGARGCSIAARKGCDMPRKANLGIGIMAGILLTAVMICTPGIGGQAI